MAILTFAQAKAQVAQAIGNATDTDALTEAGAEIQRVVEELNLKDLDWLTAEQTIALVVGTDEYNLNTDFRKIYSVRLETNKRPLKYIEQRVWDRSIYDQTSNRTPWGYNIFPRSSNTVAQIRVLPPPASVENILVKYYKLMATPSVDGTALDIVERYQAWIIYQARANILANHGENDSRIMYWQGKADRMLALMLDESQVQPDNDEGFRPGFTGDRVFPGDVPDAWYGWYY
jgi:hypothetical protein